MARRLARLGAATLLALGLVAATTTPAGADVYPGFHSWGVSERVYTDSIVLVGHFRGGPKQDMVVYRPGAGEDVILVRPETSPDDIHGMIAAEGILTSRGGLASHAALVARGWGKPAVCGAAELDIDIAGGSFTVNGVTDVLGPLLAQAGR